MTTQPAIRPIPIAHRRVYTTGQLAKELLVAPRTVTKWIDSGRLRGYRIPGTQDRRVRVEDLADFLAVSDLPFVVEGVRGRPVAVVSPNPAVRQRAAALLTALGAEWNTYGSFGQMAANNRAARDRPCVIDLAVGSDEAAAYRNAGGAACLALTYADNPTPAGWPLACQVGDADETLAAALAALIEEDKQRWNGKPKKTAGRRTPPNPTAAREGRLAGLRQGGAKTNGQAAREATGQATERVAG